MFDCLIIRLLFLQLLNLLLILLTPVNAVELVEFLFRNQILCGQPFSDAQWVPVLDQCELDCKPEQEICMEDDLMKQSCRKHCVKAFQEEQKQQTTNDGLFNFLTETTTQIASKNSQKHSRGKTTRKIKSLKTSRRKAKIATNNTKVVKIKDKINIEKLENEANLNNTEAIISPINEANQNKNKKIRISLPKIIKTTKRRMMINKRDGEMRRKQNLKMKGRNRRKLKEEEDDKIMKIRHEGEMLMNKKRAKRVENRIRRLI
uniref:Uncharacterized protein n=1 Tax=Meloidogyne hapla TaxID=6305 RepID=A0A1I8BKZ7_MELHA